MELLSTDLAAGSPPVLHVRGEVDMATADQLRSALKNAMSADPAVVVDMQDVSFIDLSGVRVLLEVAASRNGEGPLHLVHAPSVARLLDLIGFDEATVSLHICRAR